MDPNATTSKAQLESIEKVETILIDEDSEPGDDVFSSCFRALPKYIQNEDKAVRQRSLGVLEFIGQREISAPSDPSDLCNSVSLCLCDSRKNIRAQAFRTIISLSNTISCTDFFKAFAEYNQSFLPEIRNEIILYIKDRMQSMTVDDWKLVMPLVAQAFEEKYENNKLISQIFVQNESFKNALDKTILSLTPSQQKLLKPYAESQEEANKSIAANPDDGEPVEINVNSSAFARKGRNEQMSQDDGFNIIKSASAFAPFYNTLSDDIRNCFDDDIAKLLLSHSYIDRLSAVNILKGAFKNQKLFQYTIDIVLRWSGAQFIKRQVSVAQAALNLLNENLVKGVRVSKVELYFIVPIILWCVATKSAAYGDVLEGLKMCSKPADYATVLIKCLELGHSEIISNVFEELGRIEDLSPVEKQLKELARNRLNIIAEPAKTLLLTLAPKTITTDGQIDTNEPVTALQILIQRIRVIPDFIKNPQDIFGFLYNQFQDKPTDERHIRYLLYCAHAFLSEPILISAVEPQLLVSFFGAVLEFSKDLDSKFSEAINAIGFILVTVVPVYPFYQCLIKYCEEHSEEITRFCFAYQVFLSANSLFCLDRVGDDLPLVRSLGKEALARRAESSSRDPLLYCIKTLLSEVVTLEQQRRMNLEFFKTAEHVDTAITGKMAQGNPLFTANELTLNDKLIFVKIIDKIGTPATKAEGIEELIAFDAENNCNHSAINAVCKLAPSLRSELSNYL